MYSVNNFVYIRTKSKHLFMSSFKDQYLDLCEARVEALERELNHFKNFVFRDFSRREINADSVLAMFNAYKKSLNETEI